MTIVLAVAAGPAQAGSVPSNLCALNVAASLRALPITTTCIPATQKNATGEANMARWGGPVPGHSELQIYVFTGLSKAAFQRLSPHPTGTVAIGNYGRVTVDPGFVFVYAWTPKVSFSVILELYAAGKLQSNPNEAPHYLAATVAVARAAAKQLF